jgi:O-antigen ligase
MNIPVRSTRLFVPAFTAAALGITIWAAVLIGLGSDGLVVRGGEVIILGALAYVILRRPYLGVVATLASLPVVEILPDIPLATSLVSVLGGVTLLGYFLQSAAKREAPKVSFPRNLVCGLLFIVWAVATHPGAALLPAADNRSWVFTFAQLMILAWLAGRLFDTPDKHRVLWTVYAVAAVFSALFAVRDGVIGATVATSLRANGLAGGDNSAARYLVVALIFLFSLLTSSAGKLQRLAVLAAIGIVTLGVLVTGSRTGLLLLVAAGGMLILRDFNAARRLETTFALLLALAIVWFFASNIVSILSTILPAIQGGTDTVGIRYRLWQAGLRMWQDHPIHGVGIGQYPTYLAAYGQDLLAERYLGLGAHNMYIQVLAETGLVGLGLFLAMVGSSLLSLWHGVRSASSERKRLLSTWLIVLVVMLLGGLTKQDQYDKLIWFSLGMSSALPSQSSLASAP